MYVCTCIHQYMYVYVYNYENSGVQCQKKEDAAPGQLHVFRLLVLSSRVQHNLSLALLSKIIKLIMISYLV